MFKFNQNFYADVRIEDIFETNVRYKNNALDNYKVRNEKRAFIRVYDGYIWYYTSTPEISKIQEELEELYKQATPNPDIASNPIVKNFEVNRETLMRFEGRSVRDVTKKEKLAAAESVLPYFDNKYLAVTIASYDDCNCRYDFYSSKGADIHYDYQMCGISAAFAMSSEAEHIQNNHSDAAPFFDELKFDAEKFNKLLADSENFMLNSKPCKKGSFPVVLSPVGTGMFAHESFGHKSESDFMIGDETVAREWVLGKKVGSDILSIVDCGQELGVGYVPFDDEGTRARKNYLIKNGVLTGRLHSAFTAAVLGEGLTGNARAMNCKFEPIVRMTNTYIEGGESTFEQLISGIEDGYYVESLQHGSGTSTFTLAPLISYEIKNGKIGSPVKISVITGNVFETLNLIDGVTRDIEIRNGINGGCGKMEQYPLHVGFGGPYVRISKMNIQ